jgi:hypothetical protein
MKQYLVVLILMFSATAFGHTKEEEALRIQMKRFDHGLLVKDTLSLRETTHPDITYGHSNGWIETRRDLLADLYNGKISYMLIEPKEATITISGETAIVRYDAQIDAALEGIAGSYKLRVLQVWVKKNKTWLLLARQSAGLK